MPLRAVEMNSPTNAMYNFILFYIQNSLKYVLSLYNNKIPIMRKLIENDE